MVRLKIALAAALLSRQAHADVRMDRVRAATHLLPDVPSERVDAAVDAAFAAETDEVPAELLLSIAWGESRFDSTARVGRVCGIVQVAPRYVGKTKAVCKVWAHDLTAAFRAGALQLEDMLRDPRVRHDMRKALLYRACGNSAFDGTCRKAAYPGWVLRRAAFLRGSHGKKPVETL